MFQSSNFTSSKARVYEACFRNGYILPSEKSAFCTLDYLEGLISGKHWTPHQDHYIHRNCYSPPPVNLIYDEVRKLLEQRELCIGDCARHLPDRKYLLQCLSTLNMDHPFFAKDFIPEAPPRKN